MLNIHIKMKTCPAIGSAMEGKSVDFGYSLVFALCFGGAMIDPRGCTYLDCPCRDALWADSFPATVPVA